MSKISELSSDELLLLSSALSICLADDLNTEELAVLISFLRTVESNLGLILEKKEFKKEDGSEEIIIL